MSLSKKGTTRVIDEKTPLLMIAGPMFLELFLNILLNNIDTVMLLLAIKDSLILLQLHH